MTDIRVPQQIERGRGLRVGCRNKQKGEEKKLKIPDRARQNQSNNKRGTEQNKESLVSFKIKKKKAFGAALPSERKCFFFLGVKTTKIGGGGHTNQAALRGEC